MFSLPFRITISMSHTQPTQKTTSFWKPSFLSRSVDETLTEFEKLSQEQIEQLALHKSSIFSSLSFSIGASLENRFHSIFPMDAYSPKQQKVALAGLSNLLAGISYFYGSTVQYKEDGSTYTTQKGELITAIPGRSYFPRGFLWDEGFHQLVLLQWNETLSWKILKSWFARMEPSVSSAGTDFRM